MNWVPVCIAVVFPVVASLKLCIICYFLFCYSLEKILKGLEVSQHFLKLLILVNADKNNSSNTLDITAIKLTNVCKNLSISLAAPTLLSVLALNTEWNTSDRLFIPKYDVNMS